MSKVPSKKAARHTHASLPYKRDPRLLSPYDQEVLADVDQCGGFYNAHTHLCRADTVAGKYLAHIGTNPLDASSSPLPVKQNLVGDYHRGVAYTEEDLEQRGRNVLNRLVAYRTTRVDTNIDATPDLPEDGLLAIRVFKKLKAEFAGRIDIRIAPTPIFGLKVDRKETPSRWEVFQAAAKISDYLSLLPEKDDYSSEANRDGKIGFKHHVRLGVELACELSKEVQFHLDQMNTPGERGTERMLEMLEGLEQPKLPGGGPTVWVIHMISPSAYEEDRFARLVDKMLELRVGVIVCPTAALSMRQMRSLSAPIHNSIARIPELIKRGVPIRMGTDNIADVFVPPSDGDMLTEIKAGANATRMNHPSIWAKIASGTPLNNVDIATVGQYLYQDRRAFEGANPSWRPAIE